MDTNRVTHPRPTVDERIRIDAAAHPERTPSEHIRAAERIAAAEYRAEIRRMMDVGTLGEL